MTLRERGVPVFSTEAMRAADRATIEEFGIGGFTLMETAARASADAIEERHGPAARLDALVLAGRGNNGGDGLAIARHLAHRGARVVVVTLASADEGGGTPDARHNLALLRAMIERDPDLQLELHEVATESDVDAVIGRIAPGRIDAGRIDAGRATIAVDALLGIGQRGPLGAPIPRLVDLANGCADAVAIDVPTGIDSDTGEALEPGHVRADLTVSMAALKPCHLFGAGRGASGDVVVADIGIPRYLEERVLGADGSAVVPTDAAVAEQLPPPRATGAHKDSVGLALVVAGSEAYPGAAVLATTAAGGIGAGYVVCATTPSARAAIAARAPMAATVALPTTGSGGIAVDAVEEVVARATRARALLVGPGLDRDDGTVQFVRELLARVELPTVVDADGLYALAEGGVDEFPAEARARWVLTPHLGEFRRLVRGAGDDPAALDLERRTWLVRAWAERLGATLVLKGAPSVTSDPRGRTFVASSVEAAHATAGSGDVLAGTIVGLLAQGLDGVSAAVCAQHVGAAAAQAWREDRDPRSMQPTDAVEALPHVLRERFGLER
ncbi:MAG: NAD(P)H-hydrate dehydratase [Planctomycetota bacterium]